VTSMITLLAALQSATHTFVRIASYSILGNDKFLKICEPPLWRKVNIVKPENGTGIKTFFKLVWAKKKLLISEYRDLIFCLRISTLN
jgi:hypothetical protein